jgi:GT2 family glycosyltransferase
MKTEVSFVILSHNDADMAINAISSIKKLKTRIKYDIFVVDNGSKDNTPKIIKKFFRDVKVIELPKNIGTAAYDRAIKESESRYIYFTGCDIEVKPNMLDKLVNFLNENKNAAQAAPKYLNLYEKDRIDAGGTWLSRSFYSGIFKNNSLGNSNIEIPYIGTGLIRKEIIEKFGYLFDNDYFFYGEDVDLGLRIRLAGKKVFYIPDAIVYHAGSMSRKLHKAYYLTFLMERNLLKTYFTTLEIKNIILLAPYVFAMRLFAMLKDIMTLNFMDFFARIIAAFSMIPNSGRIIRKRIKVQKLRAVKDRELLSFFTEKYLFRSKK